ncbi:MAG: glycosyl transferase, group 1 [Candidatus Solibacter sp.]|nr:glycosyl transferase, group 1 [Candidatus Solibacter sp.]
MASDARRPAALFLAPEAPYPIAGGGALRSASLLEYLALHYDVDVIVFRQPGAPDPAALFPARRVRSVTTLALPVNGRGAAARALRNAGRVARRVPPLVDRFAGFGAEIERAVEGRRYALGIIEHSWCAPYLQQLAPVCDRVVLDLHNIESVLHGRCAEAEGGPTGVAHRVFEAASRQLEQNWLPRFSEVLATSEQDAGAVRAIAPGARVSVYPNALPLIPLPAAGNEEVVVFSGNMEYHPNLAAVAFFRAEIWPRLRGRWPGLVWRLVGKNPGAVSRFTAGDPRIEVTGAVDDAVAELARARVAVVPLLMGSGTRLKILEAWAAGLAVVSTTVGAEGLPVRHGETLLVADGAEAFANAVTRLLACNEQRDKLGKAGRLLLEKEFTWETAWKKLDF